MARAQHRQARLRVWQRLRRLRRRFLLLVLLLRSATGPLRTKPRAVRVKSERIRDAIDDAYAEKYDTKASQKYVRGFRSARRRDTTVEFVPR